MSSAERTLLPRDIVLAFFLYAGFLKAVPMLEQAGDLTMFGAIAVLALAGLGLWLRPLYVSAPARQFIAAFTAFCIVVLIGYLWGDGGDGARKKLMQLILVGGLYVIAAPILITSFSRLRGVLLLTVLLGASCGLVVLFGSDPEANRGVLGGDEGSYQWLSRMSCYATIAALGLGFSMKSKSARILLLGCSVVSAVSLFAGGARQALVAAVLALAYMSVMTSSISVGRRARSQMIAAGFMLFGAGAAFFAIFYGRSDLVESHGVRRLLDFASLIADFDIGDLLYESDRTAIYSDAIRLFQQNPIFGIGFGSFQLHAIQTQSRHAHDVVLELLSELGLIGFVAFAAMLVPVFRIVFDRARMRDSSRLVAACAGLLVSQIVMMLFSGDLGSNRLFFFFCILVLVADRLDRKQKAAPAPGSLR